MYAIAVYFQYEIYKTSSIRQVSKYNRITNIMLDLCLWHLLKHFMSVKLFLNMSASGCLSQPKYQFPDPHMGVFQESPLQRLLEFP